MKGSKLFLVLFLLSSNLLFSQEKKKSIYLGIGFVQCNSRVTEIFKDEFNTIQSKSIYAYNFSSIIPSCNLVYKKFISQIGFSFTPFVVEKQLYYGENVSGVLRDYTSNWRDYENPSQIGLFINNQFKVSKKTYISVNSQMIFKNDKKNWGDTNPISIGLSYRVNDNFVFNVSKGINTVTNGIVPGTRNLYVWWNNKTNSYITKTNSISFGLNYLFMKKDNRSIQPNKTYQF
jgi:hypothetical protein